MDEEQLVIDRLEQICTEDDQARRNIRAQVLRDIRECGPSALTTIKLASEVIGRYLTTPYEGDKERNVEQIRHMAPEEIVLEILANTITLTEPGSIQQIVSALSVTLGYEDMADGVPIATELLVESSKVFLVFILPPGKGRGSPTVKPRFTASPATFEYIEKTRYLDPLVCPPQPWKTNTDGGYITTKTSVILGRHTHHDMPQALDVLNILQEIEWKLNKDVLNEPEIPTKPLETKDQMVGHILMQTVSKAVYKLFKGKSFWLKWGYDKRGRAYSFGYYINIQSSSYKKALMDFAEEEIIDGF